MLGRFAPRIEHLWMLLPVVVVAWMGFMHPLRPLDFWWHLKAGEVILTSRSIPRVDFFSWTHAGRPFVYHNWLGEVLYYVTCRAGGFALLIALNTALLLLALGPIFRLCREGSDRVRVAVLCSLVAAMELGMFSMVRPQVYSFVLFAVFYWVLWGYRDGRRDYLWALPLLMILWVNLHGAFVLGIAMAGIILGAETIRRVVLGPGAGTLAPTALAKLAFMVGLTVLASMVNPEGPGVFSYVRQLQVDPSSQVFVSEWQVPDVKAWGDVLIFFVPFLVALLVFFYSHCRLSLTELGLFCTFGFLGLAALRNGIWFALVAAPMLARHAVGLQVPNPLEKVRDWPYLGEAHPAARGRQERAEKPTRSWLNWGIVTWLVLFTVMLSPWVRPKLGVEQLRPSLMDELTPVGAMDYIAEKHLTGKIFHPQGYGDYLIWRLWPLQRSFFDGRVHLYEESFVRDYVRTFHDSCWESRLAKYDVTYLLLPQDNPLSEVMLRDARTSDNWRLIYEDSVSALFEKERSAL